MFELERVFDCHAIFQIADHRVIQIRLLEPMLAVLASPDMGSQFIRLESADISIGITTERLGDGTGGDYSGTSKSWVEHRGKRSFVRPLIDERGRLTPFF